MKVIADPSPTWGFTPEKLAIVRAGVDELRAAQREIARLEARQLEIRARLMRVARRQLERAETSEEYEFPIRSMVAEVASALRESPRTARARMEDAASLVQRLPRVHEALREGALQMAHAREIHAAADRFDDIDDARLARFEERAIEEARVKTPAQTRKAVRILAEKLAPTSLQARHADAVECRGVWVHDLADGMSELRAVLASPIAHGIHERLTQMGHAVKRERRRIARETAVPGGEAAAVPDADVDAAPAAAIADERTLDQVRADLLGDLVLTAEPTAHHLHAPGAGTLRAFAPRIQVTVPLDALIDPLDGDAIAILDDSTPIDTVSAWGLAGVAPTWERLLIRPESGSVVSVDTYRPTAEQRRWLEGRDMTCRFPGCGTPARRADADHTLDWALGGTTSIDNLAHLCEPHHMLKHHSPWRVRQRGDGLLEWTSPAGETYVDRPPSRVVFRDERPPDAGLCSTWDPETWEWANPSAAAEGRAETPF